MIPAFVDSKCHPIPTSAQVMSTSIIPTSVLCLNYDLSSATAEIVYRHVINTRQGLKTANHMFSYLFDAACFLCLPSAVLPCGLQCCQPGHLRPVSVFTMKCSSVAQCRIRKLLCPCCNPSCTAEHVPVSALQCSFLVLILLCANALATYCADLCVVKKP